MKSLIDYVRVYPVARVDRYRDTKGFFVWLLASPAGCRVFQDDGFPDNNAQELWDRL